MPSPIQIDKISDIARSASDGISRFAAALSNSSVDSGGRIRRGRSLSDIGTPLVCRHRVSRHSSVTTICVIKRAVRTAAEVALEPAGGVGGGGGGRGLRLEGRGGEGA